MLASLALCLALPARAQREVIEITPGEKGPLPELSVPEGQLPPQTFAGLRLTRAHAPHVRTVSLDLYFPSASDVGCESFDIEYRTEESQDWTSEGKSLGGGAPVSVSMPAPLFDGKSVRLRLRAQGGAANGHYSNEVVVPPLSHLVRLWSTGTGTTWFGFVGESLPGPNPILEEYYFNLETGLTGYERKVYPCSAFQYQWYRLHPTTSELTPIPEATDSVYTPTLEDVGYYLVADARRGVLSRRQTDSPIQLPIRCSWESVSSEGLLFNCDYVLTAQQLEALSVTSGGIEPVALSQAVELRPGRYALRYAQPVSETVRLHAPTPQSALVNTSTMPEWSHYPVYYTRLNEEGIDALQGEKIPVRCTDAEGNPVEVSVEVFRRTLDGGLSLLEVGGEQADGRWMTGSLPFFNKYWLRTAATEQYAPTYYPGTYLWEEAAAVNHPKWGESSIAERVIRLLPALPAQLDGEGLISGQVTQGDAPSGVKALQPAFTPGTEGYAVLLRRTGGEMVAQTRTDASGHYEFRGVPYGQYDVCVNVEGCTAQSLHMVTITEAEPEAVQVNYLVTGTEVRPDTHTAILSSSATLRPSAEVYSMSGIRQVGTILSRGIYIRGSQKIVVTR